MAARLSLTFVPRLAELAETTPPLLMWASLIAHLEPVDDVLRAVRCDVAVGALLAGVAETALEIREDRAKEDFEFARVQVLEESK